MAGDVSFSLIGLDGLLGKLDEVSYDVKKRGGRSSLRKASQLLVEKVQEGARKFDDPETGRSIADNVALRWDSRRFKSTGDLAFRVGVLRGAVLKDGGDTAAGSATPHWRLKEFGTETMPAEPFMRPALADNINLITDKFLTEYDKALGRAIARAMKKLT